MNDDFIGIYENSISQKDCDKFVKFFDYCSEHNFTQNNLPFTNGAVRSTCRTDESITFPIDSLSIPHETSNPIWNALGIVLDNYVKKYDLGDLRLSCYVFKIHKVKEGEGYHAFHYENDSTAHTNRRVLAWMTYLKVPKEGGETEFLYQSRRIDPVVGTTLVWPAYFTHTHRGNAPLKGEKYYITSWFERE